MQQKLFSIVLGLLINSAVSMPALARPQYKIITGASSCTTCHVNENGGAPWKPGVLEAYNSNGIQGLIDFVNAAQTPICTAPQILQNNVCVTPDPICIVPQVLQNHACVTPDPICTAPQVLQNHVCVTPDPICTAPQVLQNHVCVTPKPAATVVRMQTSLGVIDILLFDAAPLTVANFLSYVDSGAYSNSFIHRSVPGISVQGGGYVWNGLSNSAKSIAKRPPVMNEFSSSHSNLRGTISMTELSGKPNSATSQWFFNLADNSANFDSKNGGSTVFGQVLEKSMSVVDAIAALPRKNAGGVLTQLPIATSLTGSALKILLKKPLKKSNLVIINSVSSNRSSIDVSDSDRLFAYLEAAYPEYLSPANALSPADSGSASTDGYYYRYYSATKTYISTSNEILYYLGPASKNQLISWGALSDWLALAIAAGY